MFAQETELLAPAGTSQMEQWVGVGRGGALCSGEPSRQVHKGMCLEIYRTSVPLTHPALRAINGCLVTKQVEKLQDQGSGFPLLV